MARRLALQFQQEDAMDAENWERSRQLVEKMRPFVCCLCFNEHDVDDRHRVFSCSHQFCRDCIRAHCLKSINDKVIPIPCPEGECTDHLTEGDLNHLIREEILEQYHQLSFESVIQGDGYWKCPNPGCKFVAEIVDDRDVVMCRICEQTYCLKCKVKMHVGMTCDEYASKEKWEQIMLESDLLRRDIVEKKASSASPGKSLAIFINSFVRNRHQLGNSPTWIQAIIDRFGELHSILEEGALFEDWYQLALGQRLLGRKGIDFEVENALVQKLKTLRCSNPFLSSVNHMIIERQRYDHVFSSRGSGTNPLEFHPILLRSRVWPRSLAQSGLAETFTLPEFMSHARTCFTVDYLRTTECRKLSWLPLLGRCTLLGRYEDGDKTLILPTPHACLLLLYNDVRVMTISQMQRSLGLFDQRSFQILRRCVLELSQFRARILIKQTNLQKKEVIFSDRFELNAEFRSKRRVILPNPLLSGIK